MRWETLPYLIPYLLSFAISAGVGLYALRRRAERGVLWFATFSFLQASMTAGYVFELVSPSLAAKVFWDNFQFIGTLFAPVIFLAFAIEYTGEDWTQYRRTWRLLAAVMAGFLVLVFTDHVHPWVRSAVWLVPGEPFAALVYDFSWTFWLMTLLAYISVGYGMFLLLRRFVNPESLYRDQVGTILVGVFIPVVGSLLTVLGVRLSFHRDTMPFTFAIGNLIVAWGLFRYRLFDIVPIAYDTVVESMRDAVVVLDTQDRVVALNSAQESVIGRPADQIIGLPAQQVFSTWPGLIQRLQGLREASHLEATLDMDQGPRYVHLGLSPLRDRKGHFRGRVVVVRDITDRKRAEQALRERSLELQAMNKKLAAANERLQVLSRVKDEFVSNVSHELRTPITNQKLYLHLLAAHPEKRDVYVETFRRETERLANMIEGLLTLSRLDQDRVKLSRTDVDLNDLVEEYVIDRTSLAENAGLDLTFEAAPELSDVQADETLIGQVLSILLTNAFSYTPAGGQVVVRTQVSQFEGRSWMGFSVSDTGPGISPREHRQIFTRFFRGQAGHASEVAGTGLGLAIAKEIVERHRGRIELESAGVPGKGATFRIWLPGSTVEHRERVV